MAQVKLTLRPPPNVDFVQGYPGIPPAIDRQQACVQGQVEVRVGAPNVKAKYIRVELRKIETLPGGTNFYDIVGSEPASLWTSGDEYGVLQNQDFPFMIRIPESLPPSITLEGRAGVQYELVASVSTKGKKGFFRRRKAVVQSCSAPITIDKHDLHSTWPVYCQQDSREVTHDGVTLVVERSNSCFGPGDRLSVIATVKSDSLHTVILRGFDYTLKEIVDYRGAPARGSKRANEQRKVGILDEGKLAVNATLYGGTQHRAELSLNISPKHSTTTLSSARHIDITYVLTIRGILGSGTHLVMDMPVIVSNWPRAVSQEAIRRIGAAPNLSLTQPGTPSGASPSPTNKASTFAGRQIPTKQLDQFKTMPNSPDASHSYGVGEFGTTAANDPSSHMNGSAIKGRSPPRAEASSNNRAAIAKALDKEISEPPAPKSTSSSKPWVTAEDEKKKLYEKARARVERVQGVSSPSPAAAANPSPSPSPPASTAAKPASSGSRNTPWPTSEQEKARLFEKAKAAADRTQRGQEDDIPSSARTGVVAESVPDASSSSNTNASPRQQAASSAPKPQASAAGASSRGFPSAEDEKAALRRYEEAKRAVDRTQGQLNHIQSGGGGGSGSSRQSIGRKLSIANPNELGDELPSFEDSQPSHNFIQPGLSEKERLQREYAARDAASSVPAYSPPTDGSSSSGQVVSEKEKLRRRYEAQDADPRAASPPKPPPSRSQPSTRPTPPTPPNGVKVLSAMEEKALLKARYAAEEQESSSAAPPYPLDAPSNTPSKPPPLAPRPPADYIKETQDEDARVSRYVSDEHLSLDEHHGSPFQPPPLPPKPAE